MKRFHAFILLLQRNLLRKITITLAASSIFFISTQSPTEENRIDKLYMEELNQLQQSLRGFEYSAVQKISPEKLKQQFLKSRIIYKRLAVLSEYFNVYESKYLNGPAFERTEEDNPDKLIPPQGFQAIEQILFETWQDDGYEKINALVDKMIVIVERLKSEPDRQYKFKDELVFDAMNTSLIRIVALGTSAYDSPLALNALQESVASLEGIERIIQLYQGQIKKELFEHFLLAINSAKNYLLKNNNFNKFDRLTFITDYSSPLFNFLNKIVKHLNLLVPDNTGPLTHGSQNIFEKNAFNIAYFSPDKQYLPTNERIELGKLLFYDTILSQTRKQSCASCHKPELAFTDGLPKALSIEKTNLSRNTPTLLNTALQTRQFWDSRADILENQLLDVVHNPSEMKGSLKQSVDDIKNDPAYYTLFKKAYSKENEPVTAFNIANAISSYIRTLITLNSRFDQYMRGDETKLSVNEKKGFNLFMGKALCGTCHFLPLFNGLVPPAYTETESEVLGIPLTKDKKNATLDPDLGKYNFTRSVVHKYSFKTPTLRNITLTAPYMHNGVYNTLEEVLEFYNNGGGKGLAIAPANQTLPFDKLNLSAKERKNIIAFLHTLTDTVIVSKY